MESYTRRRERIGYHKKKFLNRKKRKISKMKSSGRSCVRSRPSKAVGAQFCRNLPPTLSHTLSATFSHTCHISIYFCLGSKMFLWSGRHSIRFLWNWVNIRSWVNPAVPWKNIDPCHDHCMNEYWIGINNWCIEFSTFNFDIIYFCFCDLYPKMFDIFGEYVLF